MTAGYDSPGQNRPGSKQAQDEKICGPFEVSSSAHQRSGERPAGADSLPPKFQQASPLDNQENRLNAPHPQRPVLRLTHVANRGLRPDPHAGPSDFDGSVESVSFEDEAGLLIREAAQETHHRPILIVRDTPARGSRTMSVHRSHALFSPPANQTEALQERHRANRMRLNDQDRPAPAPDRRYDCQNYESCLNVAAALNWESFTCGRCSGEMNEQLVWQANQARRRDGVARALCNGVPELTANRLVTLGTAKKT